MSPLTGLSRRELLIQAGGSALAMAITSACSTHSTPAAKAPARRPNVLIVMSDEHHPAYTSVTGHPVVQTPNMARLASTGTVFENTYCPSPLCSPCRSAFVSGRRVHDIQWYNNCNLLGRTDPTWGASLTGQGVHTVFNGKADMYAPVETMGFSETLTAVNRLPPGDATLSRNPLAKRVGAANRASGFGVQESPFKGDEIKTESALKWLHESAPKVSSPWVMHVNLTKPHFPHFVTPELWELYAANADLPRYGRDELSANHPRARDLREHFDTDAFTDDQIRGLRRGYLGCVTYIDRQLGKLMDALDTIGQRENTIVVYTSDHGDMVGKFGMWWKCSLYDDSARVPMIVSGPGFGCGKRVQTPVDLMDLQASLFHATGTSRPREWVGTPLQTIAANDDGRVVFSEYHGHGTQASSYLVRRGNWKLIYHVAAPPQLFDLANDPDELRNLAGDRPKVMKELEAELRKICDPELESARAEARIQEQLAAIAASGKVGTGE